MARGPTEAASADVWRFAEPDGVTRLAGLLVVGALGLLVGLTAPASAPANWNQPLAGTLNADPTKDAYSANITNIGGVPYVAWVEDNGTNSQVYVKQFTGGAWTAVGGTLNVDPTKDAYGANITSIGGVPYVAWGETNGTNYQVHVKQFTGGAWTAVGGSLNVDPTKDALYPSITSVGGVPYVAWYEDNGTNSQVYVKQFTGGAWTALGGSLNVDATKDALSANITSIGGVPYVAWGEGIIDTSTIHVYVKQFVAGAWTAVGGALNVDPTKDASDASITSIGGVPYVAWDEGVGSTNQVYVKQFSAGAWTAVGTALNVDPGWAFSPTITSIGGVPYVAWHEPNDTSLVRVKRLEPDILAESAAPTTAGATLAAQVNDYGVPLPLGFELGPTAAFGTQFPMQSTPGVGVSTLTQAVGGLTPATMYFYRAFGSDTFRQTSLGSAQSFKTLAVRPDVTNVSQSASRWREANALPKTSRQGKLPVGTTFSFGLNKPATVRLAFTQRAAGRKVSKKCVPRTKRNKKKPKCTRSVTIATLSFQGHAGTNKVRFQGRISHRKKLKPGRYPLVITATDSAGLRSTPRSVTFTIVRG